MLDCICKCRLEYFLKSMTEGREDLQVTQGGETIWSKAKTFGNWWEDLFLTEVETFTWLRGRTNCLKGNVDLVTVTAGKTFLWTKEKTLMLITCKLGKNVKMISYAGNNFTKGDSEEATLYATLWIKKSQPNLSLILD